MIFTVYDLARHVVAIMELVSKENKWVTHTVYSRTFVAAYINLMCTEM